MIKQNQTYLNRLHVVMDAVCIYFAGFAAWYIRFKCTIFGFWLNQEIFDLNRYYPEFYQYQKPLISSLILLLLLYSFFGLYTPKRYQRGSKELVNLVKANMIGLGLSAFVITVWQIQNFPRSLYLLFYLFNFIFGLLSRYIIRRILKTNRKKGRNIKHTVFIGFSTSAAAYIDRIKSNPQWGLKVHGIFDDLVSDNFEYRGIKKIGTLSDLAAYLEKTSLDEVAITLNLNEYHKLEQIVAICEKSGVHTKFVPDYYNFISTNPYTEDLDGLPVINIRNVPLTNTMNKLIKRLIDIIGSIIALILFSPIMLIVAILVKKSSPGPIIFAQERIGLGNKPFKMYKFRSMYADAEERKKELMAQNEIAGGVMFKMKDDPRITKVGRVIRKFSIDELPQFFNVVGGSMSLVGTRPPTLDEVEKYERKQWRRISIKPGITGMWQVNGRSKIDNFDDIVEMDVEYIDNWSLMSDIKIILKTFIVLLKHDDAY